MQSTIKIYSMQEVEMPTVEKPVIESFSYDKKVGAHASYTINGRQEYFIANDHQLAQALEDANMIDSFERHRDFNIYVVHSNTTVEGDRRIESTTAEPLRTFIEAFDTDKWEQFITAFEANKISKTKTA